MFDELYRDADRSAILTFRAMRDTMHLIAMSAIPITNPPKPRFDDLDDWEEF